MAKYIAKNTDGKPAHPLSGEALRRLTVIRQERQKVAAIGARALDPDPLFPSRFTVIDPNQVLGRVIAEVDILPLATQLPPLELKLEQQNPDIKPHDN